VADRPEELLAIERHRFHGLHKTAPDAFEVELAGGKANLTDVAARVGLGQLARLDEFNAIRHRLAGRYFERWATDAPLRLPARGDEGHSWHMFAPLLPLDRSKLTRLQFISAMESRGIGVGVHYPRHPPLCAVTVNSVIATGSFPTPSASGAKPSRCRCSPR
jgi:dTDP-4-amino-4,6-dideoxygalactose transaminase